MVRNAIAHFLSAKTSNSILGCFFKKKNEQSEVRDILSQQISGFALLTAVKAIKE